MARLSTSTLASLFSSLRFVLRYHASIFCDFHVPSSGVGGFCTKKIGGTTHWHARLATGGWNELEHFNLISPFPLYPLPSTQEVAVVVSGFGLVYGSLPDVDRATMIFIANLKRVWPRRQRILEPHVLANRNHVISRHHTDIKALIDIRQQQQQRQVRYVGRVLPDIDIA
jgi:hypothetical protein